MNSNDVKRSVTVGVFVFIGLIIGISFLYLLANKNRNMGSEIEVVTLWHDVNGLKKGNNIWFSGVKIGNVKAVAFRKDLQVEVVLGIEEGAGQFIRKNAKAKLGADGLIGNKIVVIEGGTSDAEPVSDGDRLVTEENPGTDAMMATLQQNNENLQAITENLKAITANIVAGQGLAGHLLSSKQAIAQFDGIMKNLQETTGKTVKTTAELSAFAGKLNNSQGLLNDLMTDTLVYANLKKASSDLSGLTASTKKITENLNAVTEDLKNGKGAAGKLLHDEDVSRKIGVIVGNLEETSVKLNENMEALRHNFLFRRYFRKKAKAEKDSAPAEADATKEE